MNRITYRTSQPPETRKVYIPTPPAAIPLILAYPRTGTKRAIPAGITRFDFPTGSVIRPDANEYLSASISEIRSAFLWLDINAAVEGIYKGRSTGRLFAEQGACLHLHSLYAEQIVVHALYPLEIYAMFSSEIMSPEVARSSFYTERFAAATTIDSFAEVLFIPQAGGALASAWGNSTLVTGAVGSRVFIVSNTGSAAAHINLQLLGIDGKTWIDSSVTGAFVNLNSGDSARIEDGTHSGFMRMRVRSASAGSPTTLEVQYNGYTGLR